MAPMAPVWHDLILRDAHGTDSAYALDSAHMRLFGPDGVLMEPVVPASYLPRSPIPAEAAHVTSPDDPGRKRRNLTHIKLLLGFACNYNCTYCNQRSQDPRGVEQGDPAHFVATMSQWCSGGSDGQGSGLNISLWGGEPLLYGETLRALVPALRARYPRVRLSLITNGSLLSQDWVDFFCDHDIAVTVSHDGPGQSIRGRDPLADPGIVALIRQLLDRRGGEKVGFNCVLTSGNHSLAAIHTHIVAALGRGDFGFSTEGIVQTEDPGSFSVSPVDHGVYSAIYTTLLGEAVAGIAQRAGTYSMAVAETLRALAEHPSQEVWHQRCSLDRPDVIVVDLAGNVLTCQNEAAPELRIGHVTDLDAVHLNTSFHFMARPDCPSCAVVQICKGGCMHQHGAAWEATCRNHYHYYLSILAAALYHATGKVMVSLTPHGGRGGMDDIVKEALVGPAVTIAAELDSQSLAKESA